MFAAEKLRQRLFHGNTRALVGVYKFKSRQSHIR